MLPFVVYLFLYIFMIMLNPFLANEILAKSMLSKNYKDINDCQRCKILTKSIDYWMEKTARGKFEGGDAAWEESKLRSYSRSEIRLTEIQEGLCSEVKKNQDKCYTIAEEAEQVLEKWWFHEDPNSVDLMSWLCIETLQYCCPKRHYGESCSPCPLDTHNRICSGNGKCHGEETRTGNGTCICKKGYAGIYCEQCAANFYKTNENTCNMCHIACDECTGDGPESCIACKSGWRIQDGVCVDINECATNVCKNDQFCLNTEGSYSCKLCDKSCYTCAGDGPSNCISCKPTYMLWRGQCVDEHNKTKLYWNSVRRIAFYCGLLLINYFIFRKSKSLASIVILLVAIYLYFCEETLNIDTLNMILERI